jgi:hypothetical protein
MIVQANQDGLKLNGTHQLLLYAVNILGRSVHTIVQANQDGLKLSGTHQLLFYADAVNILGRSVHTI